MNTTLLPPAPIAGLQLPLRPDATPHDLAPLVSTLTDHLDLAVARVEELRSAVTVAAMAATDELDDEHERRLHAHRCQPLFDSDTVLGDAFSDALGRYSDALEALGEHHMGWRTAGAPVGALRERCESLRTSIEYLVGEAVESVRQVRLGRMTTQH